MPVVIGKLGTAGDLAHPRSAILFEPPALVPFEQAWRDQRRWQQRLLEDDAAPEAVWILQHPACYTLGRGPARNTCISTPRSPLLRCTASTEGVK